MAPQPYDKYTLIGKLGHGGMAEVNLAVVEGKGGFRKLTVIKRLHAHLALEPGFTEMFLDEARLAARLNHPHCVQTYEVGEVDDNHFLAMEYLDGQGLERVLRISGQQSKPMPIALSARIVADALDGLSYAHELADFDGSDLSVVHRDVSPQNIFITYNGMVKLLDFGIAKAATHITVTKTGVIKGKYAYIAPEQALGQAVDERSDLWSMGVVLWEVLTGRRLFKSINELATLHETLKGKIQLPSTFRPELPTELDTICNRALQRDPALRYQSAAEMKDELERYLRTVEDPPGRRQIGRLMKERFGEVIKLHKQTLAECLTGSGAVGPGTIQRLLPPNSSSQELMTPSFSGLQSPSSITPTPTPLGGPISQTPPPAGMLVDSSPAYMVGAPVRSISWIWKGALILGVVLLAVILALLLPLGDDDPPDIAAGTTTVLDPSQTPQGAGNPSETTANTVPDVGDQPLQAPVDPPPPVEQPVEPVEQVVDPGEPVEQPPIIRAPEPVAVAQPVEVVEPTTRPAQSRARAAARRERLAREARERAAQEAAAAETPPEPQRPPAARENGFLTLATTPWTTVSLNGRELGTTPLIRVTLPAGTHTLRLENREAGINTTYRVNIAAGELLTRRVGL